VYCNLAARFNWANTSLLQYMQHRYQDMATSDALSLQKNFKYLKPQEPKEFGMKY
jgi:hypothetical protein